MFGMWMRFMFESTSRIGSTASHNAEDDRDECRRFARSGRDATDDYRKAACLNESRGHVDRGQAPNVSRSTLSVSCAGKRSVAYHGNGPGSGK
jgi:hypothetical protein